MRLLAAGSNSHGQLALGDDVLDDSHAFLPCQFDGGECPDVLDMAFGGTHTLLLAKGAGGLLEVWAAGSNQRGQCPVSPRGDSARLFRRLDLGELVTALPSFDQEWMSGAQIDGIAALWETSLILLERDVDGHRSAKMLAFGANDWNERGIPSSSQTPTCNLIDLSSVVRSRNDEHSVTALAAGPRHVLVLIASKLETILAGWGACRHGELGLTGKPGSKPGRTIVTPSQLDLGGNGEGVDLIGAQLAVGKASSALLLASPQDAGEEQLGGRVLLLGTTRFGQPSFTAPATTPYLASTWGTSFLWGAKQFLADGDSSHGQLGSGSSLASSPLSPTGNSSGERIRLACGSEHVLEISCGSNGDGEVRGWGWNEHGNLGDGTTEDVWEAKVLADVKQLGGQPTNVWAGNATSWILVH